MKMRATSRRRRRYINLPPLTEPLRFRPDKPAIWWLGLGHTVDEWRRAIEITKKKVDEEWWRGVLAVYNHFRIDFSAPGAHKDLALSLAFRHERKLLVRGGRICYAALCERYGVNPDEAWSEVNLAHALMEKYVQGEKRYSEPKSNNRGLRLSTGELALLFVLVAAVKKHLLRNGKDGTVREVVRCLRDRKQLATVVSTKLAESMHAIFLKRGNKDKGTPRLLSDRRLRQIVGEMEIIEAPVKNRDLTPLQLEVYIGVTDVLARSSAGQNRAHFDNH